MKYINNYVLLESASPDSWASLPRWTKVSEEGVVSNSANLDGERWKGFWDGPPPEWCVRITRRKGETGKEKITVLWERKP